MHKRMSQIMVMAMFAFLLSAAQAWAGDSFKKISILGIEKPNEEDTKGKENNSLLLVKAKDKKPPHKGCKPGNLKKLRKKLQEASSDLFTSNDLANAKQRAKKVKDVRKEVETYCKDNIQVNAYFYGEGVNKFKVLESDSYTAFYCGKLNAMEGMLKGITGGSSNISFSTETHDTTLSGIKSTGTRDRRVTCMEIDNYVTLVDNKTATAFFILNDLKVMFKGVDDLDVDSFEDVVEDKPTTDSDWKKIHSKGIAKKLKDLFDGGYNHSNIITQMQAFCSIARASVQPGFSKVFYPHMKQLAKKCEEMNKAIYESSAKKVGQVFYKFIGSNSESAIRPKLVPENSKKNGFKFVQGEPAQTGYKNYIARIRFPLAYKKDENNASTQDAKIHNTKIIRLVGRLIKVNKKTAGFECDFEPKRYRSPYTPTGKEFLECEFHNILAAFDSFEWVRKEVHRFESGSSKGTIKALKKYVDDSVEYLCENLISNYWKKDGFCWNASQNNWHHPNSLGLHNIDDDDCKKMIHKKNKKALGLLNRGGGGSSGGMSGLEKLAMATAVLGFVGGLGQMGMGIAEQIIDRKKEEERQAKEDAKAKEEYEREQQEKLMQKQLEAQQKLLEAQQQKEDSLTSSFYQQQEGKMGGKALGFGAKKAAGAEAAADGSSPFGTSDHSGTGGSASFGTAAMGEGGGGAGRIGGSVPGGDWSSSSGGGSGGGGFGGGGLPGIAAGEGGPGEDEEGGFGGFGGGGPSSGGGGINIDVSSGMGGPSGETTGEGADQLGDGLKGPDGSKKAKGKAGIQARTGAGRAGGRTASGGRKGSDHLFSAAYYSKRFKIYINNGIRPGKQ